MVAPTSVDLAFSHRHNRSWKPLPPVQPKVAMFSGTWLLGQMVVLCHFFGYFFNKSLKRFWQFQMIHGICLIRQVN